METEAVVSNWTTIVRSCLNFTQKSEECATYLLISILLNINTNTKHRPTAAIIPMNCVNEFRAVERCCTEMK